MDLQRFFALAHGAVNLPDGEPAELDVQALGTLKVPSGRLAIADTTALNDSVVVPIPAGEYPVVLTTALVSEAYDLRKSREAYVSVVLSDAEAVSVAPAVVDPDTRFWRDEPAGGIANVKDLHGVKVGRIASVALTDPASIERGMPADSSTWYDEVIAAPNGGGWFGLMDTTEHGPRGTVNVELPNAADGENVVVVISRPDRLFPILETRDAAGALTGIHVDLLVIGELSEALNAFDGQDEYAAQVLEAEAEARATAAKPQKKKRGLFGLFG